MARPVWNPAAIQRLLDFGTAEAPTPLDIATLDTVIFFLYDDDTPAEQKKAVRALARPHPAHSLHAPSIASHTPHRGTTIHTDGCHRVIGLPAQSLHLLFLLLSLHGLRRALDSRRHWHARLVVTLLERLHDTGPSHSAIQCSSA
jgi:hypothetical protein